MLKSAAGSLIGDHHVDCREVPLHTPEQALFAVVIHACVLQSPRAGSRQCMPRHVAYSRLHARSPPLVNMYRHALPESGVGRRVPSIKKYHPDVYVMSPCTSSQYISSHSWLCEEEALQHGSILEACITRDTSQKASMLPCSGPPYIEQSL